MINKMSLSGAYLTMLDDVLIQGKTFMQVTKISQPLVKKSTFLGNLSESEYIVNADLKFEINLRKFNFPDKRTGGWWIQDRIDALFKPNGEYFERVRSEKQYDYIIKTLKGMKEGEVFSWNTNRLVISLFKPSTDLHTSRSPTPPCMINMTFYPSKDKLDLITTFRAQYTDAKGYGNLYSSALFLKEVSEKTGFMPGELYNIAYKATLKYPRKIVEAFRWKLMEE